MEAGVSVRGVVKLVVGAGKRDVALLDESAVSNGVGFSSEHHSVVLLEKIKSMLKDPNRKLQWSWLTYHSHQRGPKNHAGKTLREIRQY